MVVIPNPIKPIGAGFTDFTRAKLYLLFDSEFFYIVVSSHIKCLLSLIDLK